METTDTYKSISHCVTELGHTVEWQLRNDGVYRIRKNKTEHYPYTQINAIRLCFHMGGRGTPAKYCCYLQINGNWNNEYIFSSTNNQTDTADYQQYYQLVKSLLNKAQQENPSVTFIAGHGLGSLSLYLLTTLALPLLPYIVYQNHIITYNESIWATLILLLLCSPMIVSMIKFFPKTINSNHIPKSVLSPPKEIKQ